MLIKVLINDSTNTYSISTIEIHPEYSKFSQIGVYALNQRKGGMKSVHFKPLQNYIRNFQVWKSSFFLSYFESNFFKFGPVLVRIQNFIELENSFEP